VKVVTALHLHYYLEAGKHEKGGASMNRSLVILALATLATGCAVAATSSGSRGAATEASLPRAWVATAKSRSACMTY
jgi:hypothetical protein